MITKVGETKVTDPFANFMKISSLVLWMSQSNPGMSVRVAPSTPISIKHIAPGSADSRFVKYTSNQLRYLRKT